jgi:hypothetical protein
VTERIYLNGLRRLFPGVVVEIGPQYGEPLGLVRHAIAHKKRVNDPFDAVWCVFDVEAPKPHGSLDAALNLARENGVTCALSNPCFELWLLLHVGDCNAYRTTDQACELAQKHVPGFVGKRFTFASVVDGIDDAVRRARALSPGDPDSVRRANPATSVWTLLDLLRER